jgi:phosphatidylinositol glycan class F
MPLIDPVAMSNADAIPPAQAAKSSLPIDLLPTDVAKIVSQAHPAVLLAAFYFRFASLVAEPVPTLIKSILPLAALQISYALACLPAVGSGTKLVKKVKLNAPKKTELPTGNAFV